MNDKPNNDFKSANSIASVIPQVFYDFIARIIPGGVILLCLCLIGYKSFLGEITDKGINLFSSIDISPFILFCIGLIVSYVFAIILWRQFEWYEKISNLIKNIFKKKKPAHISSSSIESIHSFFYDFIKSKDYSVGARITKLRAEKDMTEVLAIGFIYCFFLNSVILILSILKTGFIENIFRLILSISLVFIILAVLETRKYFKERATKAIYNYYLIYRDLGLEIKLNKFSKFNTAIKKYLKNI